MHAFIHPFSVIHLLMQASRSRQGKMEKSFLSFVSTYPTWEPGAAAKQMLASLDPRHPLAPSPHYPFTSLYQKGGQQTAHGKDTVFALGSTAQVLTKQFIK